MKHTLLRILLTALIFPSAFALSDFAELNFKSASQSSQDIVDDQLTCGASLLNYSKRIERVLKKENIDAPLLTIDRTLIFGRVYKDGGEQFVEITQSNEFGVITQQMTLKAPNKPSILSLPLGNKGKVALQLHYSSSCAKIAPSSINATFQCGEAKEPVQAQEATNVKFSYADKSEELARTFPHIADFHEKNLKSNPRALTPPIKRSLERCLSEVKNASYDEEKVRKSLALEGGFGGGTSGEPKPTVSAKVVSR